MIWSFRVYCKPKVETAIARGNNCIALQRVRRKGRFFRKNNLLRAKRLSQVNCLFFWHILLLSWLLWKVTVELSTLSIWWIFLRHIIKIIWRANSLMSSSRTLKFLKLELHLPNTGYTGYIVERFTIIFLVNHLRRVMTYLLWCTFRRFCGNYPLGPNFSLCSEEGRRILSASMKPIVLCTRRDIFQTTSGTDPTSEL